MSFILRLLRPLAIFVIFIGTVAAAVIRLPAQHPPGAGLIYARPYKTPYPVAGFSGCRASLSSREREAMDLILEGKMNKVIAGLMGISMRTVEVHRAHILAKMHVRTAVELARLLK